MTEKEKLYETLGELLYAVAIADGMVQKEELEELEKLLEGHPFGSNIKWSFDYENRKNHDVEEVYKKVISFCHSYGPAAEYAEFILLMENIAKAYQGIEQSEDRVMKSFTKNLTERFKRDLERLMDHDE